MGARGRAAWFHCFSGISGDMALGSLLDAGADLEEVVKLVRRLPIGGWSLESELVLRAGLAATRAVVRVADDSVVRTHAHIIGLVEEARLPERVRRRSLNTFASLAEAEGHLHRRPPLQVHFHEVGGHDAIVDIVGTCAALEVLDLDTVTASPVSTGTGMVRTAHGLLPNPTPAVLEILRGARLQGRETNAELTTPTGAALLAATAASYGPMPPMTVEATGFGAGAREVQGLPNCTQVVLGIPVERDDSRGQPVALVEANVDDATGEVLARHDLDPHGIRSPRRLGDASADEEGAARSGGQRPGRSRPCSGPRRDTPVGDGIARCTRSDFGEVAGLARAGRGAGGRHAGEGEGEPGQGEGRT